MSLKIIETEDSILIRKPWSRVTGGFYLLTPEGIFIRTKPFSFKRDKIDIELISQVYYVFDDTDKDN